jgi:hypothetical protein
LHSTISSDKIISFTAPHGEQDSEEDMSPSEYEPPSKSARRGSGGKTAGDWKLHVQFQSEDRSDLINYVKDELESLIPTDISVSAHPYQKIKSNSPRKPEHGSFWHLKHPRKNGATLSCPFAATMRCPFQIKYKINGSRLAILTRSEHDHTSEIRKRGLLVAQASVVQELATSMPTGCHILYYYLSFV